MPERIRYHCEWIAKKIQKKIDDTFFGNEIVEINGKQWDWSKFENTSNFPISNKLLDWVVGQDSVLKEVNLALDEWMYKLKHLQEIEWYKPWLIADTEKTVLTKVLTPGPYLLLLGDPGTGKSLIGRAMAEYMGDLYIKNDITRFDVVAWENKLVPSNPKISIHPTPQGRSILQNLKKKLKRDQWKRDLGINLAQFFILGLGILLLVVAAYGILTTWAWGLAANAAQDSAMRNGNFMAYLMNVLPDYAFLLMAGGSLLFSGIFIKYLAKMLGGNMSGTQGIGGATSSKAPKIIVDSSEKAVPFIDATGHGSSQLFGSIAWDPYQTGGLGTPEHQRVSAGDVHRASLGILYIDEMKNLNVAEAITLLSVMEDGCLPIALRSQFHGGDTAAMAVSTQPIPALFFLLGAGNFDSIGMIHPALMDRLTGYGRVVRMNNDMPNTIENRRKYVQFITQESTRFSLPPFTRDACIEIINEGRRKSNKNDALATRFRPMISIIKTAGTLAKNKHLDEVTQVEVREAIDEHCKTIQKQMLENQMLEIGKLKEINPSGTLKGVIYGLAVVGDVSGEQAGTVLRVKGIMCKKCHEKKLGGYYKVTGVAKDAIWIHDSAEKVRSVIIQKYGIDIAQENFTHIDFSQSYSVDGPSAGVTMAILLASLIENKQIRQDVAVTGEINISSDNRIEITAVGGLYEKIKAAEAWGFKKVVIPMKNFQHSITPSDYKIEVIGAETLDDYLKEVLE